MKKTYSKPALEVEEFQLNKSIAENCGTTVSLGPEAPGKDVCKEFEDSFDVEVYSLRSVNQTPFYDDGAANCDCYYTSGSASYFTS